jgi:hypothetical protein
VCLFGACSTRAGLSPRSMNVCSLRSVSSRRDCCLRSLLDRSSRDVRGAAVDCAGEVALLAFEAGRVKFGLCCDIVRVDTCCCASEGCICGVDILEPAWAAMQIGGTGCCAGRNDTLTSRASRSCRICWHLSFVSRIASLQNTISFTLFCKV